eukprot:scaffold127351_cov24-Phaeocystis_antarctica.AAC.1
MSHAHVHVPRVRCAATCHACHVPTVTPVTCVQINKRDHGYQMAKEALIRKKALMEQVSRRPPHPRPPPRPLTPHPL